MTTYSDADGLIRAFIREGQEELDDHEARLAAWRARNPAVDDGGGGGAEE